MPINPNFRQPDVGTKSNKVILVEDNITELLDDPSLVYKIGLKLEQQGYIGELQNKLATYLAGTTKDYHRKERICIISNGESGGGKSTITVAIPERYFSDSVESFTRITAHSLDYWKKRIVTLDGKILIIKQMEGAQDIQYTIQMMTDTTSGGLKILTVSGKSGNMKTEEISLEGFPVMYSTLVGMNLDPQTMRRFLTIFPDDSPEQTKRIMMHQAKLLQDLTYKRMVETTDKDLIEIPCRLKNESAKYDVVVPFAEIIAEKRFPSKMLLARSDFGKFCGFITAITHLYYKQRLSYKTEEGKLALISSPVDYYYAWKIVEASLPQRLTGITDGRSQRILDILRKDCGPCNSYTQETIMKITNEEGKCYASNTLWQILSDLRNKGYLDSKQSSWDKRLLLWSPTDKAYNPFEINFPDEKIENVYIQSIGDKIGTKLTKEHSELMRKSMRAFDLANGSEITGKIVGKRIRDMLKI